MGEPILSILVCNTYKLTLLALSSRTFNMSLLEDCRTMGTRATKASAAAVVANCDECNCLATCFTAYTNCITAIQFAFMDYSTIIIFINSFRILQHFLRSCEVSNDSLFIKDFFISFFFGGGDITKY